MQLAVYLSGFGDATPGATTQPRANSGLIGWLVALPYLMGTRTQYADCGILPQKLGLVRTCLTDDNETSLLEVGQSSRPIPRFAGRQDTLNLVSGVLTAGVPNVQVCHAMSLRRNFLPCLEPCLKYAQNTTL